MQTTTVFIFAQPLRIKIQKYNINWQFVFWTALYSWLHRLWHNLKNFWCWVDKKAIIPKPGKNDQIISPCSIIIVRYNMLIEVSSAKLS